jgi:hypothetical protein
MDGKELVVYSCQVGNVVRAKEDITSLQGHLIKAGTIGVVEQHFDNPTNIFCVGYARNFNGVLAIKWTTVGMSSLLVN